MSDDGICLRPLQASDLQAFPAKSETLARYLEEQEAGQRVVILAERDGEPVGYTTLLWSADDPVFRARDVPEISDLWVASGHRGRGLGSALLVEVERMAATKSEVVGLNVGLHSGYGAAQRLYVRRGYVPDGSGVVVEGETVPEGATICLDDDPIVTLRMTKRGLG